MLLFSLVYLQVGLIKQRTADPVASTLLNVPDISSSDSGRDWNCFVFSFGDFKLSPVNIDPCCHYYCEYEETVIKVPKGEKKEKKF